MLIFIMSCSTPVKRCNYNECNDCSQMIAWEKNLLSHGGGEGSVSDSSGIRKDRKVRVLAISSTVKTSIPVSVAKPNAGRMAIEEARRHVAKLVSLEINDSQHAPGMEGIEILYRGRSFSGENGRKMFSDILKKIQDNGNIICSEYDIENRRSIVLVEYDLRPFDR